MDAVRWILLCVYMYLSILKPAHAGNITDAQQLWSDLFTNYNYRIRPLINQADIVNCNVSISILALNEINEVEEVMRVTAFLGISWKDEALQWNASDYGGVNFMLVPQGEVWKPDILLTNANGKAEETGLKSLNVHIQDDGTLIWFPFQKFESTCSIDVRYFPFDTQTCTMTFKAWSYSQSQVKFGHGHVDLKYFSESASWEITNGESESDPGEYEPTVNFILTFKRKPLYTVLLIILPIVFLSVMNIFVFLIPVSSGDMIGYSVTVFLSYAVFLTLIEQSMPKNSESISLLSIYMIILMGISSLIIVISIGLVKVLSTENLGVPKIFVWMSRIGSCKICKRENKSKVEAIDKQTLEMAEKEMELGKKQRNNKASRSNSIMPPLSSEDKPTWVSIMNGLVMFCLYFFTLVLVTVSLVVLIGIKIGNI